MPMYDLKCDDCSHEWEEYASVSDRNDVECPICSDGLGKVQITISAKPQVLSGWDDDIGEYVTGPKDRARKMKDKDLSELYHRDGAYSIGPVKL